MAQNPNWPVLQVLWSPSTNSVYDSNAPIYTDITARCLKQWQVRRGRQVELDQMQPGVFSTTLANRDGALNPISSLSPFAPGVLPERSIKLQAQWPPTANLLSGDMATAGEVSGLTGALPASMHAGSFYGTPSIVTSASAWQGTNVFQVPVGASVASGHTLLNFKYVPIAAATLAYPGQPYSWSTYVRSATVGANPQVQAVLQYYNTAGSQVGSFTSSATALTGSTSAGWARVSIPGTVPSGAVYALIAVFLAGSVPTSAWSFQMDGLQLEQAAAPSTWTAPGTWYPIYAGNVERYPNVYDLSGTRGLATIQATDALGLLSQSVITGSLDGLIANPAGDNSLSGAVFDYTLGDAAGVNQYVDAIGNRGYGQGLPGKYGIGTILSGVAVTSSTPGDAFLGTVQTCTSFAAPGGAGGGVGVAMSAIALPPGPNGQYGPGGGSGLGYTRMIAFKCTQAPTSNGSVLWYSGAAGNYAQGLALVPGGTVVASVTDPNHLTTTTIGSYDVGNWHLAWLGVAADGSSFTAGIDSTVASYSAGAHNYSFPAEFLDELLGAQGASVYNAGFIVYNFQGDLALYVEWPELLTTAQMSSIYTAWRTGYTGDSSGQRAAHILNWAKYVGATAIDSGSSTSLGPATDVSQIDAVTALQAVVTTEGGEHFIARDGTYTLYARSRRLQANTPIFAFGSNTAGGEIPFEDVAFDFDPTLVENNVQNTQVSSLASFYAVNEASAATFGTRSLSQSNQSTNPQEVLDQASWYAGTYGYPRIRVASMVLHPSASPALLWPVCLSLELGQYVKVTQRPMGAAVGAIDPVVVSGFVENIQITGQDAEARWVVQISADVTSGGGPSQPAYKPWNLALLHTTLHATATAGSASITIDALPTAGTSTLAQNLPGGGPGFQLTIGDGLATQETLTIQSVSATSIGYTTATVTFLSTLAHTHNPGEVIRENLGGASEANWQSLDAYSTLGTCMITY